MNPVEVAREVLESHPLHHHPDREQLLAGHRSVTRLRRRPGSDLEREIAPAGVRAGAPLRRGARGARTHRPRGRLDADRRPALGCAGSTTSATCCCRSHSSSGLFDGLERCRGRRPRQLLHLRAPQLRATATAGVAHRRAPLAVSAAWTTLATELNRIEERPARCRRHAVPEAGLRRRGLVLGVGAGAGPDPRRGPDRRRLRPERPPAHRPAASARQRSRRTRPPGPRRAVRAEALVRGVIVASGSAE